MFSKWGAMLLLGGATLFGACSHDDDDNDNDIDYEIHFNMYYNDGVDSLDINIIRQVASKPNIRKVYLVPTYSWRWQSVDFPSDLRGAFLEPAINIDPKRIAGRGDFDFDAVYSTDSLWYIQHGWTINKNRK